ncbi:MAG: TetR/AcrR family transcriptional regulator [Parvibaculum sp.]
MPRAKSYDRKTVLLKAMQVFWANGYERASIADLEEAMGINRFSIYDAFGDKKGLFLASIEAYGDEVTKRQTACLLDPGGAVGVQKFFKTLLPPPSRKNNPGCLVMNSLVELSGQDPDIDAAITANLRFVEDRMHKAANSALKSGDFVSNRSARSLARQLLSVAQSVLAFSKSKDGYPIAKSAITGLFASLLTQEKSGAKSRPSKVTG